MKRVSRTGLALAAVLALSAAPAIAAVSVFNAHLTGKDQVPSRETNATGQVTFKLNSSGTALDYRINVSNIENVVAARMQLAPAGATGPEVAALFGPVAAGAGKSSGVLATGTLTAANLAGPMAGRSIADLITEIQAGRIYVNVQTDDGLAPSDEKSGDFSSGEIRGQIQ